MNNGFTSIVIRIIIKIMSRIYTTHIFLAFMLMAMSFFIQEDTGMLFTGSRAAAQDTIPPLDEKVPANTQTATFALG